MKIARRKHGKSILTTAWLGLLFFHASLAGAADVTSSVTFKSSGLVLNRSTNTYDATVTITNTGQVPLLRPIKLIVTLAPSQVSLANKTGTTDQGKAYIEAADQSAGLNQGRSITVPLKISNPSQVKFSATYALDAQIQQTDGLPPDPGEAGKTSVAGIDVNQNGVRDDIDIFIAGAAASSARHREALKQYARAVQGELLATDRTSALAAGNTGATAIRCLQYLGKRTENVWMDVLAHILNTEQRIKAMEHFGELATGSMIHSPSDEQYREECQFDVDALAD